MALSKILPAAQEQYAGARNLVINGAMQVAQRGDVTGVTFSYGGADRYEYISGSISSIVTLSQDTDVPSNQGFSNSQKIDVTTADTSLAASDYAIIRQAIEGLNLQHLLYGTSEAKKVTLQFWVKSPKTGTHIVELYHGDAAYNNPQSYTIATADTWQKVTVTFDGYQPTAINNDNGVGLYIHWWLAAGSTYSGGTLTENTWHNTQANRAVGQVNVMDSTSNNFYLTGVQLEVGETATPFEHRSYGDELARCQRYYEICDVKFNGYGVGGAQENIPQKVTKRATPTATNGTSGAYTYNWTFNSISSEANEMSVNGTSSSGGYRVHRYDIELDAEL